MKTEKFCVYLTIYKGNKLPPFYIGYTSIKKIENGYNGSVSSKRYKRIWRKERAENSQLFITKIIKEFCNRKDAQEYEHFILRHLSAHKNELYINMHSGGSFYNYTHLTKKFNMEMSKRASNSKNYKFKDPIFQSEMSKRAHSNKNHPFHGGEFARSENKRRVLLGTHNFLGDGERIKEFIKNRHNRNNVKELRELSIKHNIKLGKCWTRRKDEWINQKIIELKNIQTEIHP